MAEEENAEWERLMADNRDMQDMMERMTKRMSRLTMQLSGLQEMRGKLEEYAETHNVGEAESEAEIEEIYVSDDDDDRAPCFTDLSDYLVALADVEGAGRSSHMPGISPYHIGQEAFEPDPYPEGNPLSRSCKSMYGTPLKTESCEDVPLLLSGDYPFPLTDLRGNLHAEEGENFFHKEVLNIAMTVGLIKNTHPYHSAFDCGLAIANVTVFNPQDPQSTMDYDIFFNTAATGKESKWDAMNDRRILQATPSVGAMMFLEAEPQMESPNAFGGLADIDISMNYYDWADIHSNYIEDPLAWFRNTPLPFHQKRDLVFVNTNCPTHRVQLVAPLMERFAGRIDSFGKCMNNADICTELPQCCHVSWRNRLYTGGAQKECVSYHYKFTISVENHRVYNYTTEKMWQALKMGSVPVYWGHPSVKQVMPGPDAAVFMEDFADLDAVGDYIEELLADEEKYNAHLAWKKQPFSESFIRETESGILGSVCRLTDFVAGKREANGTGTMTPVTQISALSNVLLPGEDFNKDLQGDFGPEP